MKKDKMNIGLVLMFIIGLSVMLYPIFSNYWNSRTQSRAIASYDTMVKEIPEEDIATIFEKADYYNQQLSELGYPFQQYDLLNNYEQLLDISDTGIMGYITINSIGVELPIYHGTSDTVLQVAAGHLEGSSLPVGGKGTHCVISAHRGLPSAKLFTDLDKLVEGDTFYITTLNRKITYKVDQIRIVEPNKIEELKIDPSKDYCTLMTCTPYGINSHRMLVRGVRVENEKEYMDSYVAPEGHQVNQSAVAISIAILIFLMIVFVDLIGNIWRKIKNKDRNC